VTQFLAGVPELLARYRNAPPAARALIHTAMDARRLGMRQALPHAFLEASAPGYLSDAEWDGLAEDWLEQALAYTGAPCKGVRGPLTRIRPRPDAATAHGTGTRPTYRLADYLDQHGRRNRRDHTPPASFWTAAVHARSGDLCALAQASADRGLLRYSAQLYKNAAAHGIPAAAGALIDDLHALCPTDPRPAHWATAHASLDDPDGVARLLDSLQNVGAHEQTAALLARDPATHVALDDPNGVGSLLHRLRDAGAHEQAAALAARAATHARFDAPFSVSTLVDDLQNVGAHEQAAALLARDLATHVSLDDLDGVAYLIESLQDTGAHEQAAILAARAAAHAPLDDPDDVASLLDTLQNVGAQDQAAALLARDPAAHVFLVDPFGVARLLDSLQYHGAHEQAAALLARDPATHISLSHPFGVGFLLDSLWNAGAQDQAAALAARVAAHLPPDDPHGVASLLESLRNAGAQEQAAMLSTRLPAAGMFKLFLQQDGMGDRFRFGREADGTPAAHWDWEDLD